MEKKKQIKVIKRDDRGHAPVQGGNDPPESKRDRRKQQRDLFAVVSGWVGELRKKKATETRIGFDRLFTNAG